MVNVIRSVFLLFCMIGWVVQASGTEIGGGGSASDVDHTSWRGAYIGQTRDDLVNSLSANFLITVDPVDRTITKVIDFNNRSKTCGYFFMDGKFVKKMLLSTCFFSLDTAMSEREFAQILLDHYDIPSFEPSEVNEAQRPLFGGSVAYKGSTTHGESVTVSTLMGDAMVTIELAPKGEF